MKRSHCVQKRWLVKRRQLVVLEANSCKIFLYVFCVRKYFCNEQKANYGNEVLVNNLWLKP